ncbi:endolytic transglycosylase MltG [Halobacillus sp. A5]|uniref:endolytic transglycosylase MltG n=1 Tax=Halobacillus sp. A5 TaxID=2880263 RepID=UPI0020A63B88|nr:endolytic transglycosylase MltG [Halobacillus sp. A5]MCP3025591.1 endolytic transglycosylase MltG [Halobacillus sp. A5]
MSDFKKSYKERLHNRSEEATTVRKIVAIVLAVLAVVLIIVLISGYLYIKSSLQPVDQDDESQINVEVPIGSSTSQIASILKENDVIKNEIIFRFYTKFKNETGFQAGNYSFTASMTLDEIIESLKTGKIVKEPAVRVTIPEGRNLEQIAEVYAEKFDFSEEEFMETANDEEYVNELIEDYPSLLSDEVLDEDIRYPLEGYLYATTYDYFVEDPSVEQIIEEMVSRTDAAVNERSEELEEMDMSVHEVITMASLIENEAPNEESRKEIAGVFYNRLDENMRLQTDPTVLYALGEHKDRVLYEDLEVDSPYNTYQEEGLPVGPISSFNANSLEATINPTESDYLYFLANSDGEIFYAETLEEHNELREEHINTGDEEQLPEDEPE